MAKPIELQFVLEGEFAIDDNYASIMNKKSKSVPYSRSIKNKVLSGL